MFLVMFDNNWTFSKICILDISTQHGYTPIKSYHESYDMCLSVLIVVT